MLRYDDALDLIGDLEDLGDQIDLYITSVLSAVVWLFVHADQIVHRFCWTRRDIAGTRATTIDHFRWISLLLDPLSSIFCRTEAGRVSWRLNRFQTARLSDSLRA